MHFSKDQIPPVKAFWSLTLYNNKQFFVENPVNRYAIGDRYKLKFNPDSSLDLYIQPESPGKDKESNTGPQRQLQPHHAAILAEKAVLDGTLGPATGEAGVVASKDCEKNSTGWDPGDHKPRPSLRREFCLLLCF